MHRALTDQGLAEERGVGQHALHGGSIDRTVIGRVLAKGLAGDEMSERAFLVIDGVDGRIRHMEFADPSRVEKVRRGMIVEATPPPPGPGRPIATSPSTPRRATAYIGPPLSGRRSSGSDRRWRPPSDEPQPVNAGDYVTGALVGSTNLASGRFAMLEVLSADGGLGFALDPWQPVLDKRIGRHISGIMLDNGGVDWSFGRKRGLGL